MKDLLDKDFGDLHVIGIAPKDDTGKKKCIKWVCRCRCGNNIIVETYNLTKGHTTRCKQCSLKEAGLKRRKSYVGLKVGKLEVIEMIYPDRKENPKGRPKVLCRCECGNNVIRTIDNLLKFKNLNTDISCGCNKNSEQKYNYINMTNKKYGRLLVIKEIWDDKKSIVNCECDCGKKDVLLLRHDVLSGHTKSCGCLQRERSSESNRKDDTGYVSDSGVEILYPSKKNKNNQQLWKCRCFCGNTFDELPARLKNNHVQSCGCGRKSIKEKIISDFLSEYNIDFIQEYTYEDCKNKYILRFDFAIINPDKSVKCLIEYDGQQHYKPVSLFGGKEGYRQTVYRDEIKNKYCKEKHISLLRLPYYLSNDEIKEKILNTIYA